jgi:hypothetical protein
MALQTANQFNLSPDIAGNLSGGIQAGQKIANQFQLGGERVAAQKVRTDDEKNKSLVNSALRVSTMPDAEIIPFLENNIKSVQSMGGDAAESMKALEMAQAGRYDELREGSKRLVDIGVRQGIIEPEAAAAPGFSLGQGQSLFDAAGNLIASVAPKSEGLDQTTIEKQLVAAGFTPGTKEFQAEVLKSIQKPVGTQINIGGEKKFQEEVQKGQAATYAKVGEEADSAIDANQSLSVLESIDVDTGALEPAKQGIAAFAAGFGVDASGLANISKGEAFNAEAKRIVLAVKASQKGPQTDKDEFTIRETVANLGNTKAGNQFIIDSARALNNRRIERKEFYDRFIEDNGGNFKDESGKTADRAWADFKRNTPLISSTQRTPEGLPVFFYKFEEAVRDANPDATRAEIIEAWKAKNKGVK